jgi:hypothetical protein
MMNFSSAPTIECKTLHDPSLSIGGRQILSLTADGWGLLSVSIEKGNFRSYFGRQRHWDLLIPQSSDVKVKVWNPFGSVQRVLEIKKNDVFKPDEKFFDDLKPILLENESQIRKHIFNSYSRTIKLQIKLNLPKIYFFAIRQFRYPRFPYNISIINIQKTKNKMTPIDLFKLPNYTIKTPQFMIEPPNTEIEKALKFFK